MNPILKQAFDPEDKCQQVPVKRKDGLEYWLTPVGPLWVPAGDNSFASTINEIYDYGEIQAGEVVIDCGANIGILTKAFVVAGAAKVLGIEPYYPNFLALQKNLEPYNNVTLIESGLWSDEREVQMSIDNMNYSSNSVVIHRGSLRTLVKLTTLDKLVAQVGLARVDFIKMDIEGSEIPALDGAKETISKFKPRLAIAAEHFVTDLDTIPTKITSICPDYEFQLTEKLIIHARIRKS